MTNKIKHHHQSSWKGIIAILKHRGTFKKWPFVVSVLAALGLSLSIIIFLPKESYRILQNTSEIVITVFPSLLGFSLGGFAIVVGFSNSELIKRGSKPDKYSVYQNLNAIFAISIMFQIFTTILAFIVAWLIKVDLSIVFNVPYNFGGVIANGLLFVLLLFGSLYSLILTPYVVTNLFTLSQVNNMFFTIQKIREDKQAQQQNQTKEGNN